MHFQLGGDLALQTTEMSETAWKHSYGSLQNWVTVLSIRQLSPVSVMTPIANCSLALPATLNTCCIRSSPWTRASLHSVSSSTQSQLSTTSSYIRSQRQKLYYEMLYCDALYWQFYIFFSSYLLCNSVLSVILLKHKWNEHYPGGHVASTYYYLLNLSCRVGRGACCQQRCVRWRATVKRSTCNVTTATISSSYQPITDAVTRAPVQVCGHLSRWEDWQRPVRPRLHAGVCQGQMSPPHQLFTRPGRV